MFKFFQKSKYSTEMLYFLVEHTLIISVQFIIGSTRKASPLQEKSFEINFEHFVSDSIFNRLKVDCSSSETSASKKVKSFFLGDCAFLEIRLTNVLF